MPDDIVYKNNIVLSDYDFQRDIDNRLCMAELSLFDVDILREIVDGSLKISIKQLARDFDASIGQLASTLNKFKETRLIKIDGDAIVVDKEMRKYYESQIMKFDHSFEPDLEYFQSLLYKVPIHHLPNWYSIAGMADNIFLAIVERYLLTAKSYQTYLKHLKFKNPVMHAIVDEVFAAPDFQISAQALMTKYKLPRQQFEEQMLHLEYSLTCCLGYQRQGDIWEEVVTPYHEWRTYLRFLRDNAPKPISNVKSIVRTHEDDFGFLKDLAALIEIVIETEIKLQKGDFSPAQLKQFFGHISAEKRSGYGQRLLTAISGLELALITPSLIKPTPSAHEWLYKSLQEHTQQLISYQCKQMQEKMRDYHELVNNLNPLVKKGWFFLDDFIKGLTAAVGSVPSVTLRNKGKKWRYMTPTYGEEEVAFVRHVILNLLFERGAVATGTVGDRLCFALLHQA